MISTIDVLTKYYRKKVLRFEVLGVGRESYIISYFDTRRYLPTTRSLPMAEFLAYKQVHNVLA